MQDVFYFTASLTMIVVFVTCIWFLWLMFIASKLIKSLTNVSYEWNVIKSKVLGFVLKILNKGAKKIN